MLRKLTDRERYEMTDAMVKEYESLFDFEQAEPEAYAKEIAGSWSQCCWFYDIAKYPLRALEDALSEMPDEDREDMVLPS